MAAWIRFLRYDDQICKYRTMHRTHKALFISSTKNAKQILLSSSKRRRNQGKL